VLRTKTLLVMLGAGSAPSNTPARTSRRAASPRPTADGVAAATTPRRRPPPPGRTAARNAARVRGAKYARRNVKHRRRSQHGESQPKQPVRPLANRVIQPRRRRWLIPPQESHRCPRPGHSSTR
jgi:hypothetical protein